MSHDRILLVEDDAAVARGLRYALESEGFEVAWARDAAEAWALTRSMQPHAFLLDIRLPDESGLDICRKLRSEGHRQPILMLTARDEEMDKVLALELGADDYVVKPYALRELISRVRALLRRAYGELASDSAKSEVLRFGELSIDQGRMQVRRGDALIELTPTEYRLLRHLALHPDHPLSRDQLIEAVWGYESDVGSTRTVDVHMRHLRQKVEPDPAAPRWLQTVRGVGYVLRARGAAADSAARS